MEDHKGIRNNNVFSLKSTFTIDGGYIRSCKVIPKVSGGQNHSKCSKEELGGCRQMFRSMMRLVLYNPDNTSRTRLWCENRGWRMCYLILMTKRKNGPWKRYRKASSGKLRSNGLRLCCDKWLFNEAQSQGLWPLRLITQTQQMRYISIAGSIC